MNPAPVDVAAVPEGLRGEIRERDDAERIIEVLHAARGTRVAWVAGAAVVLVVLCVLSLALGALSVPASQLIPAFVSFDSANDAHVVVREMRVPRTVTGVLVGLALGLAGALIQALTRNPLADPGILGVNAGAGFAVVLGVAFFGAVGIGEYIWFAFVGAVAATVVVYAIGSLGPAGPTPIRLTLAGMALGAVLHGVTTGITLLSPFVFNAMRHWSAGTLAAVTWETTRTVAPFIVVGAVVAVSCGRGLNAVALGDDIARTLGSRLLALRIAVIVAVTLLCGAATAAAGPIGFIGLMVPHVARWILGPDQRWILAMSILVAPSLLLASDIVARLVLTSGELQVGIVTALVGAPVLIALVRRRTASTL